MRNARSLATLLLLPVLFQCHERNLTAPDLPGNLPENLRAIAIRLHVDVASGGIATIQTPANPGISSNLASDGLAVRYSLLGSDGVALQSSNLTQTPLGQNKVLVRFDIAISNSLTNVNLIRSTVPAPPAGVTGIMLFPFAATAAAGSSGKVTPSADWNGAPFNFFNDVNCTGSPTSDCSRWEEYAPLAAGATSAPQTVGFEIDKSVQAFDVVMLLAADLENVPPAPAAISLSATTANFRTSDGSTPVTILVTNSGGGTLSGLTATVSDATGQPTWTLEARLSSTTAPSLLTLSAFPYVATDGTYTATVAVASAGVSNSPQTVSVTFVVTGSPIANAIYVSESDPRAVDDATCGLLPGFIGGTPCRSIMHGLFRANTLNRPEVRVADGHYTETVALLNGKKLLGGYLPDTWQRHVATTNTIIDGVSSFGNHDQTVIASGITLPTVFEGFVVHGSVNTKTGGNSYAIYVAGGNGSLAIQSNLIYGGAGGPGAQGSAGAAGLQGSDGTGRNSNPVAYDALITSGTGQCDPSNNRVYSNGGPGSGVGNMSGGNGGGTLCPTTQGLRQLSAQNGDFAQFGGGLGIGGLDFRLESLGTICVAAATGSQDGGNGGPGGNGQSGAPGLGAATADGSIVGGHWIGAPGGSGATGSNGAGGGGGGAGGGAYSLSTAEDKDRLGAVGGGGGAGGSRGFGGGPGSAGGGAFGIFIAGTAPAISDNTIIRGTGGTGGGGGTGGAGGVGGDGGAGGVSSIFCTGSAGRGGKGGNGGAGSGGGGGAGGVSFGIFTSGAGTPNYCSSANNTISGGGAGIGGLGGQSLGNVGGAGASGAFGTCSFH